MTAMSKGKVSAEILETALKTAASEGGFAFNGAAKQAQTFDGRMSNLQETISNVGLELIGVNKATGEIDPNGIFAQISEKVEKATKWLEENKGKIKEIAQIIINNIQPAIITLTALWASFKAIVVTSQIVDAITKVSDAVGKMGDGVKKATTWYQDLNKAQIASSVSAKAHAVAVGLQTAATNIATVAQTAFNVAMAANPIGLIVLAIAAVVAGLVWFFTQTEIGKQIFGEFVKFVSGVFGNIVSVISIVANAIIVPFQNFLAFVSPIFNTLWQIVSSIFILIVAVVATAIEGIAQPFIWLFQNWQTVWNNICGFVSTIWNIIVGVVTAYINTMNAIISVIVNTIMAVISPIVNWINSVIIQPIANFFSGLWNGIVNMVRGFIGSVMVVILPIANWINNTIIQPIARFFAGLWNGIVQGVSGLAAGIKNVFSSIVGIIKAPINAIIGGVNTVIRGLNSIKVPDWVPGLGGAHPNFPTIPMLAKGGVVDNATMAIIGEAGKEAVMPLENNTGWITNLAGQLAERGGVGGGNTINISVNVETKGGYFEEADAINIAKKINTALKSQGLSFDQIGALR